MLQRDERSYDCINLNKRHTPIEKGHNWIFLFYVSLTIVVYTLPYLKLKVPYIFAALLMLLSIPFFILKQKETIKYLISLLLISILFMLRCALSLDVKEALNEAIRNIRFFLPVLWGIYTLKHFNKKQSKFFLIIFFLLIGFLLFNTLKELEIDPMIARILAQGSESSSSKINAYRLANVGGFEFSYMMGIIALCLIWLFLTGKKAVIKVVSLIAYILVFYYILQSQYTTLLLLTFIGTVFLLFVCNKNMLFRIILVIVSLVLIFNITTIFECLSGVFEGSLLGNKFQQLANTLSSGEIDELGRRPELLRDSFEKWLKRPIFGSYDEKTNSHSLIMSLLVHTGIVGLGLWIYLIYGAYKLIKDSLKQYPSGLKLFYCTMSFLVFLSFFNPIGYVFEMTISVFFIVPVFIIGFVNKN